MTSFTPIPKKLAIIEQCLGFIPQVEVSQRMSVYKKSQIEKHGMCDMGKEESGDVSIPVAMASSQLFQYLCCHRVMRETVYEDVLDFYLQSPTFGFALKVDLYFDKYNQGVIVTDREFLECGEETKFREKALGTLRRLGERGTYLTTFAISNASLADVRAALVTTTIPKLARLEDLQIGDWLHSETNKSRKTIFPLEIPEVKAALPSMIANGCRFTLQSLELTIHSSTDEEALGELKCILSQTSNALKHLSLRGRKEYSRGSGSGDLSYYIDNNIMEIISECCPRIVSLKFNTVKIETGFFKKFFHQFTLGLRHLYMGVTIFTSEDALEFRYLADSHAASLETLYFSFSHCRQLDLGLDSAGREMNNLLALFGRLVPDEKRSGEFLVSDAENDLICFPHLRSFNCQGLTNTENLLSVNFLTVPIVQKIVLSSYQPFTAACPIRLLHNLGSLSELRTLKITDCSIKCNDVHELNDALNKFGEGMVQLRDLSFACEFDGVNDFDYVQYVDFTGWKNMKNMKTLGEFLLNGHLLGVIAKHWIDNFEEILTGVRSDRQTTRLVTDAGLAALSEITANISTAEAASKILSSFRFASTGQSSRITDEGCAFFIRNLRKNANENKKLQALGDPAILYRGFNSFRFTDAPKIGLGSFTALADSFASSVEDVSFRKSDFEPACFQQLARLTRLRNLDVSAKGISKVEDFELLAKNLPELSGIYAVGLKFSDAEVEPIAPKTHLERIFSLQKKKNDIYISVY